MARARTPELSFQQPIADFLVRVHGYGVLEQAEISDSEHCIAEGQPWAFLQATQAGQLPTLANDCSGDAREEVFRDLPRARRREKGGTTATEESLGRGDDRRNTRPLQLRHEDLTHYPGVGDAKAALILAVVEFARRRIKPEGSRITTSADILPHVRHYADRNQEHFLCASINGANEILNIRVISIGLIDRTPVHPREVFADALVDRAAAIIVAHNHPTGGLDPSPADIEVTKQLKAAGSIIGVPLLDHIIFNRSGYFSLLEAGRL